MTSTVNKVLSWYLRPKANNEYMLTYLQHYSLHQRKKIALRLSITVGVILIVVLIFMYSKPRISSEQPTLRARINAVYTTFLEGAQSYFTDK